MARGGRTEHRAPPLAAATRFGLTPHGSTRCSPMAGELAGRRRDAVPHHRWRAHVSVSAPPSPGEGSEPFLVCSRARASAASPSPQPGWATFPPGGAAVAPGCSGAAVGCAPRAGAAGAPLCPCPSSPSGTHRGAPTSAPSRLALPRPRPGRVPALSGREGHKKPQEFGSLPFERETHIQPLETGAWPFARGTSYRASSQIHRFLFEQKTGSRYKSKRAT